MRNMTKTRASSCSSTSLVSLVQWCSAYRGAIGRAEGRAVAAANRGAVSARTWHKQNETACNNAPDHSLNLSIYVVTTYSVRIHFSFSSAQDVDCTRPHTYLCKIQLDVAPCLLFRQCAVFKLHQATQYLQKYV